MSVPSSLLGPLDLLAFPVNVESVLAHMRQDMRDDWFADALQHSDLFSRVDDLKSVIQEILLEGNGQYDGAARTLCDIPKKGLGIRYSLETDFYDRFVYQAICTYLIPFFDPLLSSRVLGHRFNPRREKEKYLFKNRIDLWRTFEGVTHTAISGGQALLVTDLLNYFENISIDVVQRSFEGLLPKVKASGVEKLRIRNAIRTLCALLCKWGYSDRHGLPQNRDPSSFIANVVLNDIDRKMVEMGYDYYRYVDDIRVITPTVGDARRAIVDLVGELRRVGMNVNSAKTKIISAASDEADVVEIFVSGDDRIATIDNMWRSRSRRVIARSVQYIVDLLKVCIEERESQSRQFRFAINRLLQLVEIDVFDIRSAVADELLHVLVGSLPDHPASTDQYCRVIAALAPADEVMNTIAAYLCDDHLAMHPWQNYHIWMMFARLEFTNDALLNTALRRLRANSTSPEGAAVFVYLSCINEKERLGEFIPVFEADWPYRHQRHFLIATHGLPAAQLKPIVAKLGVRLRGTANRARPYFERPDRPLVKQESPQLADLYDEVSHYD